MRRFFYDINNSETAAPLSQIAVGTEFTLTEVPFHHWCRVLRAKVGDHGILFDGLGGEYQVELTQIQKKSALAKIVKFNPVNNNANFISKIGLVMSRGERMDYAIQKATELGVTAIQLLSSHHGEVHLKPAQVDKKLNHWQQVALSACEQCGLNTPPIIYAPISINNWLKDEAQITEMCDYMQTIAKSDNYKKINQAADIRPDIKLVLAVPKGDNPPIPGGLISLMKDKSKTPYIQLLIGSEGGLSEEEISTAEAVGWQAWQIGKRVMRTETAPVVALATLQAWQDLN